MGNETIFYYVTEETVTGLPQSVKKSFWQKRRLDSFVVEKEEMTVVVFLIPRRQKGWKTEKLLRLIQESAEKHPLYFRGAKILVQPEIQHMLASEDKNKQGISENAGTRERFGQNDALLSICFPLSEKMLRKQFPVRGGKDWMAEGRSPKAGTGEIHGPKAGPESVVLLMGAVFFPEEQLQHFAEMIGPYLPRVNALTVFYETEDTWDEKAMGSGEYTQDGKSMGSEEYARDGKSMGSEEAWHGKGGKSSENVQDETAAESGRPTEEERNASRLREVIQEYTDGLYYEYGLVSRIICGTEAAAGQSSRPYGQSPSLFLDYGYSGKLPFSMLKHGGIYLDIVSSQEKEALFRRKYRGIFYQSPRKYLDTMVKSGYDN